MRRLNQLATNLYPRWWRERYAGEFSALLDDARPNLYDTIDIVKGAMAMQLSSLVNSWTPLRLIALCGVAGLLIGLGTARARTTQYESVGHLQLPYPNSMDKAGLESLAQRALANPNQKGVATYARLMQLMDAYKLYPDLVGRMSKKDIAKHMRDSIQFSWVRPDSGWKLEKLDVLQIKFTYDDPVKAQQVVESLSHDIERLSNYSRDPKNQWFGAIVVNPASLSSTRPFSDRWDMAWAGLAGGTILGAILAGLNGRRPSQQPPAAPAFEPQLA